MKKRAITIGVSLIFVVAIIIGSIYIAVKDNEKYDILNIEDGWNIRIKEDKKSEIKNGNFKTYSSILLDKGDTIIATREIKHNRELVYPIINLKTSNCFIDVYLNNKKLASNYSSKDDKYASIKRNFKVTLPDNYNKKEIKLEICVGKSKSENLINSIELMSENDYVFYQIRNNFVCYMVGSIIIILGLILMVSVICIPNKNNIIKRLFWIGCIFFIAGLGLYAHYDILEIYISSSRFINNIEFSAICLCAPCVLMISYESFQDKRIKKVFKRFSIIALALYTLLVILCNVAVMTYNESYMVEIIMLYIIVLLLLVCNVYYLKEVAKNEKIFFIGMTATYIFCGITLILSQTLTAHHWENYGRWIVLNIIAVYFVTIVAYYALVIKQYMNGITEQRILSTLAYTDPLTGINNRTKYEEYLEEIRMSVAYEKLLVVSFDLNNLKKVNDNSGHEAGDIYIKCFAKAFKKMFDNFDFIGRIGGDEFIAITEEKFVDIVKIVEKMQEKFDEYIKESNINIQASFAHGYAFGKEEIGGNINSLIKISDERMYDNKAEQKMGRD